jgi:hypothetical protein
MRMLWHCRAAHASSYVFLNGIVKWQCNNKLRIWNDLIPFNFFLKKRVLIVFERVLLGGPTATGRIIVLINHQTKRKHAHKAIVFKERWQWAASPFCH